MKQLASNYAFDATAKTVTLNNLNIPLSQILMVASKGKVLYSFADGSGAANYVQGENSILTLRNTTGLTNDDKLTIFYDDVNSTTVNTYGTKLNSSNNIKLNNVNHGFGTTVSPSNLGRVSVKIKSSEDVKILFGYDLNSIKRKAGDKTRQFIETFSISLTQDTEYSFDKNETSTGPIFAWSDQDRDPLAPPSGYDANITITETSSSEINSDLTQILGNINPVVDPVTFVSTDAVVLDIDPTYNNKNYIIVDNDVVGNFDMLLGGVDGVTFTDVYDENNFSNCKLTIATTADVSANKNEVYVTDSVLLSTVKNEFYTFYYFNTGSIVAGTTTDAIQEPLTTPDVPILQKFTELQPEASLCTVSTIAGTKTEEEAFVNGTGSDALFNWPRALTYDEFSDRLLVNDSGNYCIRAISNSNEVTTFVGGGSLATTGQTYGVMGDVDATGIDARFSTIRGVPAVDNLGNIYLADTNNRKIKKVTSGGVVTTYAGTGEAAYLDNADPLQAKFQFPEHIVVDDSGNVYVSEFQKALIRKIDNSTGEVTTFVGSDGNVNYESVDGDGASAKFSFIRDMCIKKSNGTIYIVELNKIREIDSSGSVTTLFESDVIPDVGYEYTFARVVYSSTDDSLYLLANNRIWKFELSDNTITPYAGSGNPGATDGLGFEASFYGSDGIAIDNSTNTIYVADTYNRIVRKIVPN